MDRINVDVSRYLDQKKAKTAALVKLNGVVYLVRSTFDQATGAPISQAVPVTKEAIENSLNEVRGAVTQLEALLADFDTAPEKLTE